MAVYLDIWRANSMLVDKGKEGAAPGRSRGSEESQLAALSRRRRGLVRRSSGRRGSGLELGELRGFTLDNHRRLPPLDNLGLAHDHRRLPPLDNLGLAHDHLRL